MNRGINNTNGGTSGRVVCQNSGVSTVNINATAITIITDKLKINP